ncbi:MAG: ABC transporter permease [Planctomycetaceae bacterium]|nr:ABC transporter permease [Planctomycetaceae bacterium]
MSFSRFFRTLQLALKSVLLHKLRSGLTMLGIVFGVFSVIAMLAIGEGASTQAQRQVLELGATNVIVRSIKPPDESSNSSSGGFTSVIRYGLNRKDYKVLSETIPTIVGIVPVRELTQEVRNRRYTLNSTIVGTTPEYLDMNHLKMAQGRFLTDKDIRQRSNVVVLAFGTAQILFPFENPIGRPVQIANRAYRVIGVTQERTASAGIGGSLSGKDYNKDVYMPLDTLQARLNTNDLFMRRVQGSFTAESVVFDQITLKIDNRDDVIPTAEVVRESVGRTHGTKKDYDVIVPLELLKQADQIRKIFNIVLGSIAAISLVVGGIGIMNIMLATVTERTREIGIRRALGARRRDIIQQFLTETIVLSGTGGLIGITMGLLTPFTFKGIQWFVNSYVIDQAAGTSDMGRLFSGMEPEVAVWSLPLAFGVSVAIGVIFGTYPARAAARLDPIEALRHE